MQAELVGSRIILRVPVEATEALASNQGLLTGTGLEEIEGVTTLVIRMDVRRSKWKKVLGLSNRTFVHWEDVRTVDVQELSTLRWPIRYRITIGDGWYLDDEGKRRYFGVDAQLPGIDLKRGVTLLAIRAAVLLAVVGGVGLRQVCWLIHALFHVNLSKSALHRWIEEAASQLPDAENMAKRLLCMKPVTEAHFDEIFPRGKKGPVLVVRDEHGRILYANEVEARDFEHVVPFLEKLKSWGFCFKTFYIDHCACYAKAIAHVFPDARIQYDYFHILQNVWRILWRAFVAHRKDVKRQGGKKDTPGYCARLEALAKRLWETRGLIFTADDHLTPESRRELHDLVSEDPFLEPVRTFLGRVRAIFTDSASELGAFQRLNRLRDFADEQKPSAYDKAVRFLESHFPQMVTFLRSPDVKRNSLAETGMRTLRRLEQGHDGFRTAAGRDRYLRLFQAIRYCGWTVHRSDASLALPALPAPS